MQKKWANSHTIIALIALLSLVLLALLLFSPKASRLGLYDFEELSPAVSRYPNFYALMIEPKGFPLDLESASLSAAADLASKLRFAHFTLIHREAVSFNPAAHQLWATVFNLRGQNVQMATSPDRSGAVNGFFVLVFMYNTENEASQYALMSSQLDAEVKSYSVAEVQSRYRHSWQAPTADNPNLRAEARLRLTFDDSLKESINVVTFQNDDSKRWPFLLALDTSQQEAIAHGFPYFIVLEASISGEMVAMQVRTRYLYSNELPEDLYRRGYRAFMIRQAKS
jgi:hypothetical protein